MVFIRILSGFRVRCSRGRIKWHDRLAGKNVTNNIHASLYPTFCESSEYCYSVQFKTREAFFFSNLRRTSFLLRQSARSGDKSIEHIFLVTQKRSRPKPFRTLRKDAGVFVSFSIQYSMGKFTPALKNLKNSSNSRNLAAIFDFLFNAMTNNWFCYSVNS